MSKKPTDADRKLAQDYLSDAASSRQGARAAGYAVRVTLLPDRTEERQEKE